jgi:nicotinamidase-related amidase
VALLLIDVINDMSFPDGRALLRYALPMAHRIRRLKLHASALGIPAIYVNDNFGRWRSDFGAVVRHCARSASVGHPVVRLLRPHRHDYFVLKPKHSGFFQTALGLLLEHLRARRLILTGLTAEQCVFFTASDAHMRDYELLVPADCVASSDPKDTERALGLMTSALHIDITPSIELDIGRLQRGLRGPRERP